MFKRCVLFAASAFALASVMLSAPAAQAADLLPPPPPEFRSGVYDWSGMYLGGLLTGAWIDNYYIPVGAPDPDLKGDGLLGGVYAGYNYQMGSFVFGVEGDAVFGLIDAENIIDEVEQDIDFIATIRARLGYAHDRTMAYVAGGVAFLDSEVSIPAFGESDSKTHTGWTIGGGLEHAWTDNFVGRLEYLYAEFDEKTYDFTPGQIITGVDELHMIRVGGAWKF